MQDLQYFEKDDGTLLPVSDDFLIPFLNPTSVGTNYWDHPPPGIFNNRMKGRVILQLHQLLHMLNQFDISLKGKHFLDIGTGNGLIPRLLLEFSELSTALGTDPYLSGEKKFSWHAHDADAAFLELRELIFSLSPNQLRYNKYKHLLEYENHTIIPRDIEYPPQDSKQYRFEKIGAHDLHQLNDLYDIFYIKALDHIHDWPSIFRSIRQVAKVGTIFIIKHYSFFSFLGPHRYATTTIPWGHILLSDSEYRRFAHEYHGYREQSMLDFYFQGLAYPRTTMSNMVKIARENGFLPKMIINEAPRHAEEKAHLISLIDNFWGIVRNNHPGVSEEEVMSGRYHILFQVV